jgi:dolichol-phosphate mannosyltransferase
MSDPNQVPVELTVIVPTFRERDNIELLVELVREALRDVAWEMVFVDDNSGDATAETVWAIGRTDHRVRCLKRVGRRGLASACIEGMLSSGAPYFAVMDADLQHDPGLLPAMLEKARGGQIDLVIASRYMPGGSVGDWDPERIRMSSTATRLARVVVRQPVSDPMSGYFLITRGAFEAAQHRLSVLGFKILLDLIASSPVPLRLAEVPLRFNKRQSGESKLATPAVWEFLLLIADKLIGRYVPVRFVAFAVIGASGVVVHFAVLSTALEGLQLPFAAAQAVAVVVSIIYNYVVNNVLTYRDVSLTGTRWWRGLASFGAICGVGAVANVGIASFLFNRQTLWPLAAVAGIFVGSVWNYAMTSRYTWET